jgi:hypothetical protein
VLAIFGSGVQARSHLEALRLVRRFEEVRVWSPHNAEDFAQRFDIGAAASAEEAVRGADVSGWQLGHSAHQAHSTPEALAALLCAVQTLQGFV